MSTDGEHNQIADSPDAAVKFTVVVTTYNYAHLLVDALGALAAQTVSDFELLIVDDGSTDNTEQIVQQFQPQFQDCRYLKKANGGAAAARNHGVNKARGTHIAILDADDIWSPYYLETIQKAIESRPQTEIVFCNGVRILADGRVLRPVFPPGLPQLEGHVSSVESLFSVCDHFLPSGMVFRKSLFTSVGAFDTRFSHGDDVEWVIRVAMAGAECLRIDQKLFLHRFHGSNLTHDPIAFLGTWLTVYEELLRTSRLGEECERRARSFARDYVLRLLGICSPAEGRLLLTQSMKALKGDFVLRAAYLSTFLGSSYALRPLKWVKQLARRRRTDTRRLDLTAPPEIIFQSL